MFFNAQNMLEYRALFIIVATFSKIAAIGILYESHGNNTFYQYLQPNHLKADKNVEKNTIQGNKFICHSFYSF